MTAEVQWSCKQRAAMFLVKMTYVWLADQNWPYAFGDEEMRRFNVLSCGEPQVAFLKVERRRLIFAAIKCPKRGH
jgi:hypothetical protein